ncbi:MAG: DUF1579 family protein [Planctomycetota bacterium]
MFLTRFAAVTAATVLSGVAIAAIAVNPFQEGAKPTKEHRLVLRGAGQWEGTLTMNMPEGQEPMVMKCRETVKPVGQLWTVSEFTSDLMGQPFAGSSTFGYDAEAGKFVGTWVDSATTTLTNMVGRYNQANDSIVMVYKMKDQMTGEMADAKMVLNATENTSTSTFYKVTEEGEELQMTIEMRRVKVVEAASEAEPAEPSTGEYK